MNKELEDAERRYREEDQKLLKIFLREGYTDNYYEQWGVVSRCYNDVRDIKKQIFDASFTHPNRNHRNLN